MTKLPEASPERFRTLCAYIGQQYTDACDQTAAQEREIIALRAEILRLKCGASFDSTVKAKGESHE